jgi:pSer/pThr/pTyr-binding forkhead associated (FHA) protein
MASLIVISGSNKGDYYPLGHRSNVVGRDEAVPIQIVDPNVSRKHMQIRFEESENKYYVIDMKSKHGVFINGRKIDDEAVLTDNDCIGIGQTALLFTLKDITNRESALSHFKKVGERQHPTISMIDNDTVTDAMQ